MKECDNYHILSWSLLISCQTLLKTYGQYEVAAYTYFTIIIVKYV
jgi:hypothetical protein